MDRIPEGEVTTSTDNVASINCTYLKTSNPKTALFVVILVLTGGLFYLPYRWLLSVQVLFYTKCSQNHATHIKVTREKCPSAIVKISEVTASEKAMNKSNSTDEIVFRIINYNNEQFYYEPDLGVYLPLIFNTKINFSDFHRMNSGISTEFQVDERRLLFGKSVIDVPIPSLLSTFIDQVLRPFFVFQIFSIILWCTEEYYWYAIAIFFIMCVTLTVNIYFVQSNLKSIKELATYICEVEVKRNGSNEKISSTELVPGDIIIVSEDFTFPCDSILLEGFCLVDETMLTGESQPVMKEAMPNINTNYSKQKLYSLSAGTKAISCNPKSFAIVISTGYTTAKGELVRSILYPKPNRFKFERDSLYFVAIMGGMALIGFFIAIKPLQDGDYAGGDIAIKLLDLITIAVPPALPLTMTIGIGYSMGRLKRKKISCINQSTINAAGRVSVVCFDKTGTLTKDEMSLKKVYDSVQSIELDDLSSSNTEFLKCMAACHSLTMHNSKLIGDPQEIAISNALCWRNIVLDSGKIHSTSPDGRISIFSRFTYHFSPEIKRMGVVVDNGSETILYMKGAPEVIIPLCKDPPEDIHQTLLLYTREGYRVLACAYKVLSSYNEEMKLDDIENDLQLLGFPLLENPIKDTAEETLKQLSKANIHCMISTGDNVLTGMAVGKRLGMIKSTEIYLGDYLGHEIIWEDYDGKRVPDLPTDRPYELVITGNLVERIVTENLEFIPLIKGQCRIFGRMAPKHKIMLIEAFQIEDVMVAMVGDGANDCGALKQADVGLSLSEAEASIAAPFSSVELNSIIYILQEGRCALTTSFQCFKFMMMYSVIQFTCAIMLYQNQSNLTNNQFIYQDVFNVLPVTFTMAASLPYHRLSKRLPPGSLISVPIIVSIIGIVLIIEGIIVAGYLQVTALSWYDEDKVYKDPTAIDAPMPTIEGNAIFMQGTSLLIVAATIFSIGKPFRQEIYRNNPFIISCTILLAFNVYFILGRSEFTYRFIDLYSDDYMDYRWIMIGIFIVGSLLMFAYERFAVPVLIRLVRLCIKDKRRSVITH